MQRKVLSKTVEALEDGVFLSSASQTWVPLPKLSHSEIVQFSRMYNLNPEGGGESGEDGMVLNEDQWEAFVATLPSWRYIHPESSMLPIDVVEGDILTAAAKMAADAGPGESPPGVLNMASASHPGGGYKGGAGAQEENFFRRSDYSVHLDAESSVWESREWTYPIPTFGGIFTAQVRVFRGPQEEGYPFMETILPVSAIAVAAQRRPAVTKTWSRNGGGRVKMTPAAKEKAREKIRAIFKIAIIHGCTRLALSALGCGAYRNPPDCVARLFHSVLHHEFGRFFHHVVFAIYNDHNATGKKHNPRGNYLPFAEVFASSPKLWDHSAGDEVGSDGDEVGGDDENEVIGGMED